jgi:hypothetical protein
LPCPDEHPLGALLRNTAREQRSAQVSEVLVAFALGEAFDMAGDHCCGLDETELVDQGCRVLMAVGLGG